MEYSVILQYMYTISNNRIEIIDLFLILNTYRFFVLKIL